MTQLWSPKGTVAPLTPSSPPLQKDPPRNSHACGLNFATDSELSDTSSQNTAPRKQDLTNPSKPQTSTPIQPHYQNKHTHSHNLRSLQQRRRANEVTPANKPTHSDTCCAPRVTHKPLIPPKPQSPGAKSGSKSRPKSGSNRVPNLLYKSRVFGSGSNHDCKALAASPAA